MSTRRGARGIWSAEAVVLLGQNSKYLELTEGIIMVTHESTVATRLPLCGIFTSQ
jgi:hypothetical protein